MEIIFDPTKARENLRKHGISLADAAWALHDPMALTIVDDAHDEERFVTVGMDLLGRILAVVYTYRGAKTRLISARPATRNERDHYEKGV